MAGTLDRLFGERYAAPFFEVIIADGGSTDATVAIAESYGCRIVHGTRGRAPQMTAGARVARGRFLYFLHADTLPPQNWIDWLYPVSGRRPVCFRLSFGGVGDAGLWLFAWLSRWPLEAFRFGDQSLYVSRVAYDRAGGFDERLLVFEDNELLRRLPPAVVLPVAVETSPRKYLTNGVWYTQAVYVSLYLSWRLGVGQSRLRSWYERWLA